MYMETNSRTSDSIFFLQVEFETLTILMCEGASEETQKLLSKNMFFQKLQVIIS